MITHFVNYYGQQERLREICEEWYQFPCGFTTMVIDDGSAIPGFVGPTTPDRLIRIREDIHHNYPGTMNLAAALADTEWLFHTDMDVKVTRKIAKQILGLLSLDGNSNQGIMYFFNLDFDGKVYSGASFWLVRVKDYWKAGGYDEDFSGHYGSDDNHFMQRAELAGFEIVRPDILLEHVHIVGSELTDRNVKVNSGLLIEKMKNPSMACNNPLRFDFEVSR